MRLLQNSDVNITLSDNDVMVLYFAIRINNDCYHFSLTVLSMKT
jgi:hypothetical protein